MKAHVLFALYLAVCFLHMFACIPPEKKRLRYLTKPMLMPLLALWLAFAAKPVPVLIVLGLLAGCIGDSLLLAQNKSHTAFVLGAYSFAVGHALYIVWFLQKALPFGGHLSVLIPAVCVYAVFVFFWTRNASRVTDNRTDRQVIFYFALISMMSLSSLAFALRNGGFAWICWAGSLLFMISDSILTYNKFIKKHLWGNVFIMGTYILAQTGIALGVMLSLKG